MFNTPVKNFINKEVKLRENMSLDVSLSGTIFIRRRWFEFWKLYDSQYPIVTK